MSQEIERILNIKSEYSISNEEEETDETKRKSRNLNEKKRRDQFNELISELNLVVTSENRKVDKSTILKAAINNLKNYQLNVSRAKEYEINEEWKPSILTNDEYTYLMLQSVGGFVIVFKFDGRILFISNNLATIFGHSVDEIVHTNFYNLILPADRVYLENLFFMSPVNDNTGNQNEDNYVRFCCQFFNKSSKLYEPVEMIGCIKELKEIPRNTCGGNEKPNEVNKSLIFMGFVKQLNPLLYSEFALQSNLKTEFISHHNFEWKFLFLDERASSIIGYSPLELLGTSGYDYYHVDDLENIAAHHRLLMVQDEGVSGYYRFMTKGHQWIWLQTTSYINRRHWNSRVEFVVCTHRVVKQKKVDDMESKMQDSNHSFSSGCSVETGGSNFNSPPSWISSASESNFCEEEDGKEIGRMSHTYQKRFTEHEDSSLSSNQSEYQACNNSEALPSSELIESNLTIEDTLQKKCSELEQIIADSTEELRALSQQLYLARSNNQQNKDVNTTDNNALNVNYFLNLF